MQRSTESYRSEFTSRWWSWYRARRRTSLYRQDTRSKRERQSELRWIMRAKQVLSLGVIMRVRVSIISFLIPRLVVLVADYLDFGCIALAVLSGLQAQHSAISKLNDRIRQVLGYITAVKAGETAWDHEAMRQIQTVLPICRRPSCQSCKKSCYG